MYISLFCRLHILFIAATGPRYFLLWDIPWISGLPPIDVVISQRRHSQFGRVRRMHSRAPAHQALHLAVSTQCGSRPDNNWRRPRGRPRNSWVKQIIINNITLPDAWTVATDRSTWRPGATTQRWSSVAEREREREREREDIPWLPLE